MVIFFPSIHPSLLSSCRNASKRTALPEAVLCIQETDAEDFPWLLRVGPDPQTAKSTAAKSPANCRFWILDFRLPKQGSETRFVEILSCVYSPNRHLTLDNLHLNHLISLLARASTSGGIVTSICFAVFKLITSSNLVGCSTGKSAGLAPFRILST